MSPIPMTSDRTEPEMLIERTPSQMHAGLGWQIGVARPTAPDDLPASWLPSRRARNAEAVAQAVLTQRVSAERLCTIVADLRRTLGVDHAQISIISDRQIALVVDGQLADVDAVHDNCAPTVSALENTLCVVAMRSDRQLAIGDATADGRVASTPAVASGLVGSYLGSPIRVSAPPPDDRGDEITTGVLCIYQARPHDWTRAEAVELDRVADEIADELRRIRDLVGREATGETG